MKLPVKIALTCLFFSITFLLGAVIADAAGPSPCIPPADQVTFSGVQKQLLPLPNECPVSGDEGKFCGRGEHYSGQYAPSPQCAVPTQIVMHTTHGHLTAESLFDYFNRGSEGRGVGSHFGIGQDGKIIQMVEMGKNRVEYAQTVGPIDDHISIEMAAPGNYGSIAQQPAGQYQSSLKLVKALMKQYNIGPNRVVSHGSLGGGAGDPGEGWMTEFRNALKGTTDVEGLPVTGGNSTSSTSATTGTTGAGGKTEDVSECVETKVGSPDPKVTPEQPAECANEGSSSSGGTTGGGGPAGPCMTAPPPPGDITAAIQSKWGITVTLPGNQMPYVWEEFHEIDCTGLLQDIRGTIVRSWGAGWAEQFSCPGTSGAQGEIDVMFHNGWVGSFMKAILTHELTHVWQFCSSRGEANLLEVGNAYRGEGGLTKYSRRECGDFVPGLDRIYHEDQADTIALYMNPDQGELTCGNGAPNPFTGGRNPLHNSAAKKGLGR